MELVVTGSWTPDNRRAVLAGEVDKLVLNYALGFNESRLDFLHGLPLRELVLLDPRVRDLAPIHSLGGTLRSLSVSCDPSLGIDLRQLSKLESLAAAWPQVSHTVGAVPHLETTYLRAYDNPDLTPLSDLRRLKTLVMKDRPKLKSLVGLRHLSMLTTLEVYGATQLTDIQELIGSEALERLVLEGCSRIGNIAAVASCGRLRYLNLSDCKDIDSLLPVVHLAQLEVLHLFGTTRVHDNDLGPLVSLPRLQELRMQSRRSYRPSVEAIQASLPRT